MIIEEWVAVITCFSSKNKQNHKTMAQNKEQLRNTTDSVEAESGGGNYLVELLPTGVGRYLQRCNQQKNSGVDKYLAMQLLTKEAGSITGVRKYLARQSLFDKTTPISGVSQYMTNKVIKARNEPLATSLTKYIAKQLRDASAKAPTSGVGIYLVAQEKLTKKAAAASLIAKYQVQGRASCKSKGCRVSIDLKKN